MRHWLAVVNGTLVQFTGSSFQFQFFARFDLWELDGCQQNCVVVYAS